MDKNKGKPTLVNLLGYKKTLNFANNLKNKINKKIIAVVACGNGTAGIFAPEILRGIGCEVIELDCNLDFTFPNANEHRIDYQSLIVCAN